MAAVLLEAGAATAIDLVGRSAERPPLPPPLVPHTPRIAYAASEAAAALPPPDLLILAVPDDNIASAAASAADWRLPTRLPVLHLSGAMGPTPLASLAALGHPVGSLHPLVALPDAFAATRLRGAWFAVEGDPSAAEAAERIVAALRGQALRVTANGKPLYHAAAVAASNLVVALLSSAEAWMGAAGVDPGEARAALAALAMGAVEGVARSGPQQALTGPVARGDAGTVAAHLARLSPSDRTVYSVLSLAALQLAEQGGLDPQRAAELRRLLESTE